MSCGYQGYEFGAHYPDSICCDGYLWDADSGDEMGMDNGGDMDVMAYKLASPQASTVTVKLTDINEYLAEVHDKTLNRALRLLAEGVRAGDVAAMRAAGIKVEAE